MATDELPRTDDEWQEAVDVAHGLIAIESARAYGFIEGGPHGNVERCEEILALGKAKGINPREGAIESTVDVFLHPQP